MKGMGGHRDLRPIEQQGKSYIGPTIFWGYSPSFLVKNAL